MHSEVARGGRRSHTCATTPASALSAGYSNTVSPRSISAAVTGEATVADQQRLPSSRTLASEQQLFDITLEEALAVYAQPKYGARAASSALKEFEADPTSGKPIKLKDGRFGPYVTDGETNATIPRGENAEEVTFERAVQLLADKRAKGPAPKRKTAARKTTTTRKPAAKKK